MLIFSFFEVCSINANSEWTEWRGDTFHTALEDGEAPKRGELIWKYETGGPINSSPVFRDNEVIIGSDDGYLYGINSTTGILNWRFKTNGPIRSTALIKDDLVYFGSMDGQFYCINVSKERGDPFLVWDYTAEKGIISSAHYYNGTVFFGDLSGHLYRVGNGILHWKYRISRKEIWSSPIIDSLNGYVYITDIGNSWVTIKLNEGTHKRTIGLSGQTNFYSTGVLDSGTLFTVGGDDKKLHAQVVSMTHDNYRWGFYIGESALLGYPLSSQRHMKSAITKIFIYQYILDNICRYMPLYHKTFRSKVDTPFLLIQIL